jgi:hypothetical protein
VARELGEEQRGTASVVTNWVLVEQPGPWGYRALAQSRLPDRVAAEFRRRARTLRVRVVLIRRPGRSSHQGRECLFVHAGRSVRRMERLRVDAVDDVLDLDWSPLTRAEPVAGDGPWPDPVFLVCTNGARDPCCAERGRPVAAALAEEPGRSAWECSHIGGDRFAANLVCFPHGIYYGRVAPREAADLATLYDRGLLDLAHYRGRACYDFATQAAETFVRERWDIRGIDDVRLIRRAAGQDRLEAEFETTAGRARVVVAVHRGEPRRLTCRSPDLMRPPVYRLAQVEALG